jgi:2-(1,2-epoxy-1,2-dihydrophenyl)acetyl-CoA isomerase
MKMNGVNTGSRTVLWEQNDGIGVLTLNRPEKYNAMTREVICDLIATLQDAAADDAVKTIVITGAGKAFCSGADLTAYPELDNDDPFVREHYLREVGRVALITHAIPKPVIAAVNGAAGGGGMDLAMGCDIRFASDKARFSTAFVRVGLMPDMGGSWLLPRLVGLGKALELLFSGDVIDAQEALRIGLVNRVIPHEDLMPKTMEIAGQFAQGPALSYKRCKWAVYRALNLDFETAIEHEMLGQNLLLGTADVKNAVKAFTEKRTPRFEGK